MPKLLKNNMERKLNMGIKKNWKSVLSKISTIIIAGGLLSAIIIFILGKIFSNNLPPEAKISINKNEGVVPCEVIFDGKKSLDPEGQELQYFWYIDDKNISNDISFNHVFKIPNNYKITLTVEDPKGLQGSDIIFINVLPQILSFQKDNNKTLDRKFTKNKSTLPDNNENLSYYKNIPEEQIRRDIGKSLENGEVDKAIKLLELLSSDEVKDEESELIFNHCLANKKLEKAKVVKKLFKSDSLRKEADLRLSLELIKK